MAEFLAGLFFFALGAGVAIRFVVTPESTRFDDRLILFPQFIAMMFYPVALMALGLLLALGPVSETPTPADPQTNPAAIR